MKIENCQQFEGHRDPSKNSFVKVQFSSVAQSCPTLCDPMNRSTPGLPVHHQLPEFTQTHVRVRDIQFSSVQFSHSVVSDSLQPHESQHARPPCPSPTAGVHSNSRPSSRWCHPAISSSVVPFSSCLQLTHDKNSPQSWNWGTYLKILKDICDKTHNYWWSSNSTVDYISKNWLIQKIHVPQCS